jgi:protein phosphatase 1 regulatory subunit 7
MKQERINNPTVIDRAGIEAKISAGFHVILQFDGPHYTPELLGKINNLCGEFGQHLAVRFYGHYGNSFDAINLRFLPDVASLWIDCLLEVKNLSVLNDLANLHQLSLGIYQLDDPNILNSIQLKNIERLVLCENAKSNIDLAPLEACRKLTELFLNGHTKNIDCLAELPILKMLSLGSIPNKNKLDFVSQIRSLKRLVVILGGREDISEIHNASLEELEILRVRGLNSIDSISAFPSLRLFAIEDQIRLKSIRFTPLNNNLQSLRIINCKKLHTVEGLGYLLELKSIRIGMTALDIKSILEQRLAASLKTFTFHTGKVKENEMIRNNLNGLGYSTA